ncbi:MAG: NosD domain-containing protein, partial [Elusimicrobiota bacterium]|nr:NosD domain-containing protein [Elusimicrobiota bacterium]
MSSPYARARARARNVFIASLLLASAAPARAAVTCTGAQTYNVPGTYATISLAVAAITPTTLTEPVCVTIGDDGTYAEQVTVQGFTNNGSSITIQAAPGFTPVVSPPALSTAAFLIANASVNVQGISAVISQSVPYGVWASSGYVSLSSVSVSTSGNLGIYTAGVRISSWSAISYSSVTVWGAHGFWLDGATATAVAFSAAVNKSATQYPVFLDGGKNNDFTALFARNSHVSGYGLYALGADSNTVTQSYLWGGSRGAYLDTGSDYNAISLSTTIGNSQYGLYAVGADSNTVTQSYLWGGQSGADLATGADYNSISLSTMIGNSDYGLVAVGADSNIVKQSYLWGGDSGAFLFPGSDYNAISLSTVIGNSVYGLFAWGADSNTVTQSYVWGGQIGGVLDTGADNNSISLSTMIGNSDTGFLNQDSDSNTVTQ